MEDNDIMFDFQSNVHDRDVRFGHKVGQIGPKWDKSWTFSDQILVHFGSPSQNVLKSDLKSPGFVTIGGKSDLL